MSRVLMVSSEAAPFAKTGGLADVVGALPLALRAFGDEAAVVIPRYRSVDLKKARRVWDDIPVYFGAVSYPVSVYQAPAEYPVYLVDCPLLYDRKGFYGESGIDYPDNHIRFAVLCRAALGVARFLFRTDIFHCHDWQSALVPAYLRTTFASDPTFLGCRTLFTIHNLGYQGLFPKTALADVALDPAVYRPDGMEFFGQINYIKAGIQFADGLNTVSPTYAREIQTPEFGCGLDGCLRDRAGVLSGILNGVDYAEWSPHTDRYIAAHFTADDLSGKAVCKQQLLEEFGLPPAARDRPLLGVVSRFTRQKGTDLLAEIAARIVVADLYLVALGEGEPKFEELIRQLQQQYPGRIAARIGFDNPLAHRIEAGADIFLMPSRYEPGGLNQIYSLHYGTVPVVRATGGLDDTIEDGTGFKFAEPSGEALWEGVRAAVDAFAERDSWQRMMRLGMKRDFSWKVSAAAYSELYRRLLAS